MALNNANVLEAIACAFSASMCALGKISLGTTPLIRRSIPMAATSARDPDASTAAKSRPG